MRRSLDRGLMLEALEALDNELEGDVVLVVGGGAAMILAYDHPLATQDVDAFAARGGLSMADLDAAAHRVAERLRIAPDWLNEHFVTFTAVLPGDYATRLRTVFTGAHLEARALGREDLLIMKCFAGRDKDIGHARHLIRLINDLEIVDARLAELQARRYPGADAAADFFDDLRDMEGI